MENPIVFRGHAQKGHVVVGPRRILRFQRIRLLGEELGRGTADFDGDLAIVLVGGVVQRVQALGKLVTFMFATIRGSSTMGESVVI